jgi:threonine aldolase
VFNAAAALGVDAAELTEPVDSVMFCLSKGLAAPVGSILAGSADFITEARKYRKVLGGGMRQAGVLAAAGLVALDEQLDRLTVDNTNAARLARGLAELEGIELYPDSVQTNIVLYHLVDGRTAENYVAELAEKGVLGVAMGPTEVRLVTHNDVDASDVQAALERIAELH